MLENQARRQAQNKNDKEVDGTLGKWGQSVSPFFDSWLCFFPFH
jgi:hypothetical protein